MQSPNIHKSQDRRKRPSSGLSPAVGVAEGVAILTRFCSDLSDRFVTLPGARISRWMPGLIVAIGLIASFTLVYIELAWFFFGFGFAVAGSAMCLLVGDEFGLRPIRLSLVRWLPVWPVWEYAIAAFLTISLVIFVVWSSVWGSVLLGSVVGIVVPALHVLTVGSSIAQRRDELAGQFNRLIEDLGSYGIDPRLIETGLPKLMGENWIPLFERQFGYPTYRSVAQYCARAEPEWLRRRPSIRDFIADAIAQGIRSRRGPIVTLWKAREDQVRNIERNKAPGIPFAYWESTDLASDDSCAADGMDVPAMDSLAVQRGVNQQDDSALHGSSPDRAVSGHCDNESHRGAEWSEYLSSGDWEKLADADANSSQPGRRKREYDEMMSRARGSSELDPAVFQFERTMYRFLGDEIRLGAAIVLLIAFVAWAYQINMITGDFFPGLWSAVKLFDPGSISASIARVTAALTQVEPSLLPIGVSGWSTLIAAVLMGISSEQAGWRHSLFAIPASILVIGGMTATLVAGQSAIVGWLSVLFSMALLSASSICVRHRHQQLFQQSRPR